MWRSIRVRILLPVLVAIAGVVVLGTMHIADALAVARQADRAATLARGAGMIASLVHEVGLEYATGADAQRQTTQPATDRAVAARDQQRGRTDAAVLAFAVAARDVREAAPDLDVLVDAVDRSMATRSVARAFAATVPDDSAEVFAYYDNMADALIDLVDALPPQMTDRRLIELTRSVAITAELDRLGALQLDLVTRGLARRLLNGRELSALARYIGAEDRQAAALNNLEPAASLYDQLSIKPVADVATGIRQSVLDGRGDPDSLSRDPAEWVNAQSQRLADLRQMELRLAADLDAEAAAVGAAARNRSLFTGAVTVATALITLIIASVLAVRITRQLRRTRRAALTAARTELPSAISNVIASRDAESVRGALTESSGRIDAMLPVSPDEIGELAAAFGAVHRQALRLAADQALLRMEVEAMFIALSRRGQTLIQRQIHLIDEFGRNEADPDALSRLFALDHLAARMRRNEENLLVLAGGEPGRWITRPVATVDLLRAAAQEIEEYRRIQIMEAPTVAVAAYLAGDAIHLLAELFENATSFSPPQTMVRVAAFRRPDGLLIAVTDSGIGMPLPRVSEVNERLAHPSALTSTLVGTMGLLVVARLALRHGIRVHLESVPAGGTTASVLLPDRAVVPITSYDQLQPARRLPSDAADLPVPEAAATSMPPGPLVPESPPRATVPMPRGVPVGEFPVAGAPPPGLPGRPEYAVAEPAPARPGRGVAAPGPPRHQAEPQPVSSDLTGAGLPRRSPETGPPPGTPPPAEPPLPQGMPDPEAVRARLSSLASGIAAAGQREPVPPPTPAPPAR